MQPSRRKTQKWTEHTCSFCALYNSGKTAAKYPQSYLEYRTQINKFYRKELENTGKFTRNEINKKAADLLGGTIDIRNENYGTNGGQNLILDHNKDTYQIVLNTADIIQISNGIVNAQCTVGPNNFGHAFAIVNGWLLDSITNTPRMRNGEPSVYRWEGIIHGYDTFELSAGLDYDRVTPVLQKNYKEEIKNGSTFIDLGDD